MAVTYMNCNANLEESLSDMMKWLMNSGNSLNYRVLGTIGFIYEIVIREVCNDSYFKEFSIFCEQEDDRLNENLIYFSI